MGKEKTQFKKGHSGNPAGKPKGSKNRTTDEMRVFLQQVIDKNYEKLEEDLAKMSPSARWMIIEKMSKYFMPTLTKNDNDTTINGGINIRVSYDDTPIEYIGDSDGN